MKKLFIVFLLIFVLASAFLSGAEGIAGTYTTNFPLTENPISENGNWVGGQTAGGNLWGDCRTASGYIYGVSQPQIYGDPTAIVTGSWGANQNVRVTYRTNGTPSGGAQEAEIRLRTTINSTNHTLTGYEVYCSVLSANKYCRIASWNTPTASRGEGTGWENFNTSCTAGTATCSGGIPILSLQNGDVLTASVVTNGDNSVTITGYVYSSNGTLRASWSATDTGQFNWGPWTSGNPGVGFYDNTDNNWNYFGFSSFAASDETTPGSPGDGGTGGGSGGGSGGGGCFIGTVGHGTQTSAGRWIVLGLIAASFASLLSLRITN
jgi:hypothetical protein